MKYTLLLLIIFCAGGRLAAQYVYTIKADSVRITGCDSSELIVENHTQGVKGFLFNTGNGRTQFKKGLIKIDDTTYIIGADTLKSMPPSLGWLTSGNSGLNASSNFLGSKDSVALIFKTYNQERARFAPGTGNLGLGGITAPTARLHLGAGTTAAGTAPLKLTSGALMTTSEAGAIEFLADKAYLGITTGNARKEFTLNNIPLPPTSIPYATTNGRLNATTNFSYNSSYGAVNILIPGYSYRGTDIAPMDDQIGITLYNNSSAQALSDFNRSAPAPGINFKGSGWSLDNSSAMNVQFSTWMQVLYGNAAPTGVYTICAKINGTNLSIYEPFTDLYKLNSSGYANLLSGMYIGDVATAPTALLHLAPGTASAGKAPLKLTSGALLSAPEEGAVEYDGTDIYLTEGSTRYKLSKTLTGSMTTNFGGGSLAAFSSVTSTLTVTGAQAGDVVSVSANTGAANPRSIMITGYVTAANVVTLCAYNAGNAAVTLASDNYKIRVVR